VTPAKPKPKVLILAREAVIGGLIGMLLEIEGYDPVYAAAGERAADALARVRPPLVVLLDGELEAARNDLFLARAAKAGAGVVLFSPPHDDGAIAALARERGLPHFTMPCVRADLAAVVRQALGRAG
jgi:DNA-binding response OmpR family regulator